ncbi:hypothetical protein JAAARDRAFT_135628 [Jaapia argillacea MUCL 33604]|uniref:Cytochrome P450 n=1 Tax=Jaapia argillacea MUCL 33604 TaxID=933084 RepID=A0A067PKM2_9AGAM|nr:hypothetical protein JAAARDRAFT_135628 [Jaapia argillacea MUCL 33604]
MIFPKKGAIYEVGGFSILNAWTFFSRRCDFLRENFKKRGIFQFWVMNHKIVALSGDEGRKVFFTDKNLDFTEGYKILMGGAPRLDDIAVERDVDDTSVTWFNKRLATLLRKERLEAGERISLPTPPAVLPSLFNDIQRRMDEWGTSGKINPFENVYDLVFQMTVRMATCQDLSNDIDAVKRLHKLYWILEKSATPTALLLPWLPSPAKKAKEQATRDMFVMLHQYVENRRKADDLGSDALDMLIAEGDSNETIIQFVMGVTFAGVVNTGMNSCWILLFLAANPDWQSKVRAEVNSLMDKHTDPTSSDPLHKRLSTIPVPAWEDSLPVLDMVIRETIRIILSNGTTLRRNIHGDLRVGSHIIEKGSFMAYNVGDAHMNPEFYPDPEKFDPGRYEAGREEDKKGSMRYLGWGVGRHPCTGMRVAKLEIKMIVAMFLVGYEYELVDGQGKFPNPFPKPDRNDIQQARPVGDPCYLEFKRVVE